MILTSPDLNFEKLWDLSDDISTIDINNLSIINLGDLLINAIRHELGETEARNRFAILSDLKDQNIQQLLSSSNYIAAINKLRPSENTDPKGLIPLITLKIILHIKIQDFNAAEYYINSFSNNFIYNDNKLPETNLVITQLPYTLRYLYAVLPLYKSQSANVALERLQYLLRETQKVVSLLKSNELDDNIPIKNRHVFIIWEQRIFLLNLAICACYVASNDYLNAIQCLKELIDYGKTFINTPPENENNIDKTYKTTHLYVKQILFSSFLTIRILVKLGNLTLAQSKLSALELKWENQYKFFYNNQPNPEENNQKEMLHWRATFAMHKGLLALTQNVFDEARAYFYDAFTEYAPYKSIALNNIALTHLYSGHLQSAIDLLETELDSNSGNISTACNTDLANPDTIYNLCSMYELRSSDSLYHKRVLLQKCANNQYHHCKSSFGLLTPQSFKLGVLSTDQANNTNTATTNLSPSMSNFPDLNDSSQSKAGMTLSSIILSNKSKKSMSPMVDSYPTDELKKLNIVGKIDQNNDGLRILVEGSNSITLTSGNIMATEMDLPTNDKNNVLLTSNESLLATDMDNKITENTMNDKNVIPSVSVISTI